MTFLFALLECKYKESLPLTDMWYINGQVESLPLTNRRYISGWVESIVLRRKVEDFSIMRSEQMKKTGFYIIKDKFFGICLIRISKAIRKGIDHTTIALKIHVQEFTG